MATFHDIASTLGTLSPAAGQQYLTSIIQESTEQIKNLCKTDNLIVYASGFLQKSSVPASFISISREDINGFMSALHGIKKKDSLTIILHTPGGELAATHTIVDYLHQKFKRIEVIVPTFAMSAGTMICLGDNKIYMGRQSQLGPIDPQLVSGGISMPAQSIISQFNIAKEEIQSNPRLASAWQPILAKISPSLLQQAQNASDYGERLVASWLGQRMFGNQASSRLKTQKCKKVAHYFNDVKHHKMHGNRVSFDDVKAQGLEVALLEDNQPLQEAALTVYHAVTAIFEKSPATKLIFSSNGKMWAKNFVESK